MSAQDGSQRVSRRAFLGAAGAAASAGAAGTAAAQESGGTKTVNLVDYAFKPGTDQPLQIKPGTTVKFVWKTSTHNIVVDSQPKGASWSGVEQIHNTGFTYEHTFQTKGTYEFHCQPHKSLGMTGTIEVTSNPSSGGGGGHQSILPDSARTLGVAATGGMVSVLGLSYFFLKYGGDYGDVE